MADDNIRTRSVNVRSDEIPSEEDVLHLILRLPYLSALSLAGAIEGDVDKMVDGAHAFLLAKQKAEESRDAPI